MEFYYGSSNTFERARANVKRVPTGVDELYVKLSGGYPLGKGLLVTGVSDAGNTFFGLRLLHRSCVGGMNCVPIATEEAPEDLLMQAEALGLGLAEYYHDRGQLIIGRVFESLLSKFGPVTKYGFAQERLDIHSTARDFRDQFDALNFALQQKGCTTMFAMDESTYIMTNRVADYSVYGSVRLMVNETLSIFPVVCV